MTKRSHHLGSFSFEFETGGKLVSLTVGRHPNLLYEGQTAFDIREGLTYRIAGWDEVFPTIEPHGAVSMMGWLVRFAPALELLPGVIRQVWHADGWRATREFRLESERQLRLGFEVINTSANGFPFLWACHPMLSLELLREVQLPDGSRLHDFALDGSERKWFLPANGRVRLDYSDGLTLAMATDQPWWGLWLDKGGWPLDRPGEVLCLGVEATTTPGEVPDGKVLAAGETFRGHVTLEDLST